jgi:hypothetical protein
VTAWGYIRTMGDVCQTLTASEETMRAIDEVRFRHRDGSWVKVCALVAPDAGDHSRGMVFALVGSPGPFPAPAVRVDVLESPLRRIGLGVRAAVCSTT